MTLEGFPIIQDRLYQGREMKDFLEEERNQMGEMGIDEQAKPNDPDELAKEQEKRSKSEAKPLVGGKF